MSLPRKVWKLPAGILLLACCSCSPKAPKAEGEKPKPVPPPVLPRRNYDLSRLFNGIDIHSRTESGDSGTNALATAADPSSYLLELTLRIRWPKAGSTETDLLSATPELSSLLPSLGTLLKNSRVSPDFATLREKKEKSLQANLLSLQRLPYRDSLFDCQTILEINPGGEHPKALLIQAIMNVNTDGSDGDRNLPLEKLSSLFQPQTNYRWPKASSRTNPCLPETEARLALLESGEDGPPSITPEQRNKKGEEIRNVKATIMELKRWSFLVGTADPFIVLPSFMVGKSPGQPSIGDYAIVIAHGSLYPAVIGDLGPSYKIGEASLRLCREIDSRSGADHRPASRPDVVYLIFPGSADKPLSAPDYKHWGDRCRQLWKSLGGSDLATWHEWTSLEKPWPAPSPSPGQDSTDGSSPSPEQTMALPAASPLPTQPSRD